MTHEAAYHEERLEKQYDVRLLRRLIPFSRPYRKPLLGAIVLAMLITGMELGMPIVTKEAVDRYIVPPQVAENGGEATRYLRVSPDDPSAAPVIDRHPDLFRETEDGQLRVALSQLDQLSRAERTALRRSDLEGVLWAAALYLGLVLASFGLNYGQVVVMERAGQGIMHDLRMTLYRHIQGMSLSYFNRTPVARLVTRNTNDIQNMHEFFTSVIVFVFKDVILILGIAAVMLSIHAPLALACLSVLPVVMLAAAGFARLARDVFRTLRIKTAEINTRFSETIAGIRVIQTFRQEAANAKEFWKINHEYFQAGMRQVRVFGVFMPLIDLLNAAALACVIYFGGQGVLDESISLGVLVAFISYMRLFFRPIREVAEKYNILQNAMSSAERIFLILDTDERISAPESPGAVDAPIRTVEFDRVRLHYIKDEPVLRGVSFRVGAGEKVALVGPTGSGKTSLVNLIVRFYDATGGRVRINGWNVADWDLRALRSRIAVVSQDPFLFSGTLRDNIVRGNGDISDAELERVVDAARCREMVNRLPEGVDSRLSEGGASLSSGERQLISIARAFARDPDLIILDEATSYIDSETEVYIQEAIAELTKDRTAIVVAHRLSTARDADSIVVLVDGRVIESGSHSKLMEEKGFYYRLHQLQGNGMERIGSATAQPEEAGKAGEWVP
jgi:ATP-binding cassette subfamily B protein